MSDVLDFVNMVRINDLEAANRAGSARYELDKRADYIKDKYGVKVPGWYEFGKDNPPREPKGFFRRLGSWAISVALIGGVALGGMALLGLAVPPVGLMLMIGAGVAAMGAFVDDDRPATQLEQVKKYTNFLNAIETSLENSPCPYPRSCIAGSYTRNGTDPFREMVEMPVPRPCRPSAPSHISLKPCLSNK